MPTRERPIDLGIRLSTRLRQLVADELRQARIGFGLSQGSVGRACGISQPQVSRIERALAPSVGIEQLCRMSIVLGLDLSIKFYPGGAPLRDKAQLALLGRFRTHVGLPLRCQTEVPVPLIGDRRAWDMTILGARARVGLEAETRLRDCQAVQRRIALKARDSGIDQVILLVSDTHANRAAIQAAEASLREMFPIPARAALRALRAGRDPGGSAIILL
jgi:transcriptional regulator with XRE-family HTH domain